MKLVDRIDAIELRPPHQDPLSGNVTADAFVTRTGVLTYRRSDGSVTRELRHPDDVFKEDSMETLRRISVTDEHPNYGAVTIDNAKHNMVGFTGDIVERADDMIRVPITIVDRKMLTKMRKRLDGGPVKSEVSCGYKCNVIPEEGEYNGERYDHRQTDIHYNHIAVTWKGRAGDHVRVRMDSEGAVSDDLADVCYFDSSDDTDNNPGEIMVLKIKREGVTVGDYKMDSFEVDVPDEGKSAVEAMSTRLDAAHDHMRKTEIKIDTLTGERDGALAQVKELQTKLDKASEGPAPEVVLAMAKDLSVVTGVARHLKIDSIEPTHTVGDIRRKIVELKDPKLKEDASDEYIEARYDAILVGLKGELDALDSLKDLGIVTSDKGAERGDAGHTTGNISESPRDRFMKKQKDASKEKGTK